MIRTRLEAGLVGFYQGEAPTVSAHAGLEATHMVEASHKSMDNEGITVNMGEILDASI